MSEETVVREFYEYERVKEIVNGLDHKARKLIKYAELLVPVSEDLKVYGKNLFNKGEGIKKELYFFTKDKIYLIKETNAGIDYQILYVKNIRNIEYKISDNDEKVVILRVEFSNSEIVEMKSVDDSGTASIETYRDTIQSILQTLI
ncbi:DUF3908 family protein [Bacillus cereus]|uniref:DUF3908 family protein n=1 Tax=Bacillus mycoides TaxID=1405 RepID=UPI001A21D02D|nr:DUF3908 family protein [Bacillus mycoides]MBJ7997710.1 DUF3908 family protein [Bacillus cereus]